MRSSDADDDIVEEEEDDEEEESQTSDSKSAQSAIPVAKSATEQRNTKPLQTPAADDFVNSSGTFYSL